MRWSLALVLLAACGSFSSGTGGGGDDTTPADGHGSGSGSNVGSVSVFDPGITRVVVEIDYEHGEEPYTGNIIGFGDTFAADGDVFTIDERSLKLGMIWQWKANKGGAYAEDMGSYGDALAKIQGADKPAPILIGRRTPTAEVQASYPYPINGP